jgi:hypothetical protein
MGWEIMRNVLKVMKKFNFLQVSTLFLLARSLNPLKNAAKNFSLNLQAQRLESKQATERGAHHKLCYAHTNQTNIASTMVRRPRKPHKLIHSR